MYWLKSISDEVRTAQLDFKQHTRTKRLVLGSIFAGLAAILQSAGGYLPGIGYVISPFATAPILFCSMLSIRLGLMSFMASILLLLIFQPSELFIFPFTTGLLGMGIGVAFHFFKKRLSIIVSGSILLTSGIFILLFILKFPILGPSISGSFSFTTANLVLFFSFFYSWIWVDMMLVIFLRIKPTIAS